MKREGSSTKRGSGDFKMVAGRRNSFRRSGSSRHYHHHHHHHSRKALGTWCNLRYVLLFVGFGSVTLVLVAVRNTSQVHPAAGDGTAAGRDTGPSPADRGKDFDWAGDGGAGLRGGTGLDIPLPAVAIQLQEQANGEAAGGDGSKWDGERQYEREHEKTSGGGLIRDVSGFEPQGKARLESLLDEKNKGGGNGRAETDSNGSRKEGDGRPSGKDDRDGEGREGREGNEGAQKQKKKERGFGKKGKGNWKAAVGFDFENSDGSAGGDGGGDGSGGQISAKFHSEGDGEPDDQGKAVIVTVDRRPPETVPELAFNTVLLIICADRPDYLKRTLKAVEKYHPCSVKGEAFAMPVVISQDGHSSKTEKVISSFKESMKGRARVVHMHHEAGGKQQGNYFKLSAHYKWALEQVFDKLERDRFNYVLVDNVIILEEDLEIAPDFFDYFAATQPLLAADKTLMAVSAWNDNGQDSFVKDNKVIHRSDFFPGLGWMMPRRVWFNLRWKWPEAYWDDWLREPDQRQDRQFLRPEVCRTYHFGKKGTSKNQFGSHLDNIMLNDEAVPFRDMDLSFLRPDEYKDWFVAQVSAAREIDTPRDLLKGKHQGSSDLKLTYRDWRHYEAIARQLGIMSDRKAGVPRTGYMGVVSLWFKGTKVFIVPQNFGS